MRHLARKEEERESKAGRKESVTETVLVQEREDESTLGHNLYIHDY